MPVVLWELPVASTALFYSPELAMLSGRECKLSFSYEGEDDDHMVTLSLVLQGVESYKCTYLSSCRAEMFTQAYDRLVDLGKTSWLTETLPYYLKFRQVHRRAPEDLRHLMICFDDGPCYEFICTGFSESSVTRPYERGST
jgi:hypothetical protein